MNGPEVKDPSPTPEPESSTVGLVGFGPSFRKEGPSSARAIHASASARRRKRRRIILGTIILILVLGVTIGPGIYRFAKIARAASLARSAEEEAQKGQIDEAVSTVRSAYMMAPNNFEVLRAMAQILSALNAPSAMNYWNWVLESRSATTQDRRDAAECALKLGLYNQAGAIIKSLLEENARSAPNLLMAARYYALAGSTSQAMNFASRATGIDPNYKPAVIFLALQELRDPSSRQSGVDSLLKVARGDDAFAFLSMQRLAQEPNLKPEENQELLNLLQAHPRTAEAQKIVELILQLKLHPDQHDNLIRQAVASHSQATVEELRQFGTWLNSAGESWWVFDLIPKEKIYTDKDLFLIYLDALGDQKKWNDVNALLGRGRLPLETPYVELYLFRAARELGDAPATDLHWRSAQVAASHSPRQSLYLAGYAEKLGESDRAEAIYRTLTQDMMAGRPAYLGLLRIYRTKSTIKMRNLLDQMAVRWPQDEAVNNDDVYYNLLLDSHVRENYDRAVKLAKADVYSAPHLTDVALAYLRLHDPAHAAKVFENSTIQWESAAPSTLVVYAATLKANGHDAEAAQILSSLNRNSLRPEEQALIKNIP